ncbi:HAD family hydrolase [Bacillus sp. FJAT-47783]|uniref:HAD family hydrolase n=1 Tax=Bacillus sp. FJAT-47783 TaxID=2922712 RepID=UPI001FADD0A2|nr:HAD family hydrolase [Bacillus sp. FJAT-47783]
MKAIFFDLDDTLLWDEKSVEESFQATCQLAYDKYGVDVVGFEKAVKEEAKKLYMSYETYSYVKMIGINPFEALWSHFSDPKDENLKKLQELAPTYRKDAWNNGLKAVGINDQPFAKELSEQFGQERRKRPYVYDDTFEVLDELKGHVELLLLTNGDPSLQKEKIESIPSLASYFKHIIISGEFGKGKPSTEIFQHALHLMGVTEDEVMMVGDKLSTDILGANKTKIPSVWLNRKGVSPYMDVHPTYEVQNLKELVTLVKESKVSR